MIGDIVSEQILVSGKRAALASFPMVQAVSIPGLTQSAEIVNPTDFVVDYAEAVIFFDDSMEGFPLIVTYTVGSDLVASPDVQRENFLQNQVTDLQERSLVRGLAVVTVHEGGGGQTVEIVPGSPPKALISAYICDDLTGDIQAPIFQVIDEADAGAASPNWNLWLSPGRIKVRLNAGLPVADYRISVLYFY